MRISGRQGTVKMTVDNLPIVQFTMSKRDVNRSKNRSFKPSVSEDKKVIHNLPGWPLCHSESFTKNSVNQQTGDK